METISESSPTLDSPAHGKSFSDRYGDDKIPIVSLLDKGHQFPDDRENFCCGANRHVLGHPEQDAPRDSYGV